MGNDFPKSIRLNAIKFEGVLNLPDGPIKIVYDGTDGTIPNPDPPQNPLTSFPPLRPPAGHPKPPHSQSSSRNENKFNYTNINKLIVNGFDKNELIVFIEDKFETLSSNISNDDNTADIGRKMVSFMKKKNKTKVFLIWAQSENKNKYKEYLPYEDRRSPFS